MRHYPWFWGTLAFWLLLGTAGLSRALLWGPPTLTRQAAGRFHCLVNGNPLQADAWISEGTPEEAADKLENEWAETGWRPLGDGDDYFPLLLGITVLDPEVMEVFHRCVQVRVFKRDDTLRVLGVLRSDKGMTVSGLTVDLDEKSLVEGPAPSEGNATPAPPPEGTAVTAIGADAFHLTVWDSPPRHPSLPDLHTWCLTHSIRLEPWSSGLRGDGFIATRSGNRWFLNVKQDTQGTVWVWMNLPNR